MVKKKSRKSAWIFVPPMLLSVIYMYCIHFPHCKFVLDKSLQFLCYIYRQKWPKVANKKKEKEKE